MAGASGMPAAAGSEAAARRALVGCMYAAMPTGSLYAFGMYSAALKREFGLSQAELSALPTFPLVIGFTAPLWGLLSARIGVGASFMLGGTLIGAAQVFLYLFATRALPLSAHLPAWLQLMPLMACSFAGLTLLSGVVFTTPVLHWPRSRGLATATVKSFTGASGALVSQMYVLMWGVPGDSSLSFRNLLMWAVVAVGTTAFGAAMVPVAPSASDSEPRARLLRNLVGLLLLLALAIGPASLLPAGSPAHTTLVVTSLALALAPLAVAAPATCARLCAALRGPGRAEPKRALLDGAANSSANSSANLAPVAEPAAEEEATPTSPTGARRSSAYERQSGLSLGGMLRTADCWLMTIAGVAIHGAGALVTVSAAQVIEASGAPERLVPSVVTLVSLGNMLGRLLCMNAADAIVAARLSRAWALGATCALMAAAHAGFALGASACAPGGAVQEAALLASAAAAGLAFGAYWPLLVVLDSELFGSAHLRVNYMFHAGVCAALGGIGVGYALPARFYHASHGHTCVGPRCFGPAHAVAAGLCVAGAAAACAIALRSRDLYARIADAQARAKAAERERAAGIGAVAPRDAEAPMPRDPPHAVTTSLNADVARKAWDIAP